MSPLQRVGSQVSECMPPSCTHADGLGIACHVAVVDMYQDRSGNCKNKLYYQYI